MTQGTDRLRRPLIWISLAALISNACIVVTGATVRLTSSGLGCPTWPQCTASSYVPTGEYGIHGVIEFGNRLLTFVVVAIPIVAFILAWQARPRRPIMIGFSLALVGGIFLNALVGGLTVLTTLNPWVVAAHFLPSPILVTIAYAFWVRAREPGDGPLEWLAPPALRVLAWLLIISAAVTVVIGTVVTGSGPHAGDSAAVRTGFDPEIVSMIHADAAILLVGLTVAAVVVFSLMRAPAAATRAVWVLLAVELAQVVVGYTQYFTKLPVLLVAVHVTGAIVLWIAALRPLFMLRRRGASPAPAPASEPPVVPAERALSE